MEALTASISSANALLVFDVVARLKSITRAAEELHVTQVAVSRMISRLEKSLGTKLFLRARGGLTLTEDGVLLEEGVTTGLRAIESAVTEIKRRHLGAQTVTLSLSSAFVAYWLMPRYHRFLAAFPDINLRFQVIGGTLSGGIADVDLALRAHEVNDVAATRPLDTRKGVGSTLDGIDCAITASNDGLHGWRFAPEVVLPVCSPQYLARHGRLDRLDPTADKRRNPTLIEMSSTALDWAAYAQTTGMTGALPNPSLTFSDYALVLQAATLGQGLCLGWLSGISYALRTGTLVPASEQVVRTGREYRLFSAARDLRPQVRQVKDWMVDEMAQDMHALHALYPAFDTDVA